MRSDVDARPSSVDGVSIAAAARSDGSRSVVGGSAAAAPATAPAAGTFRAGRFFFFAFGFARTTGFAFGAGRAGRCTLGPEGVGATTVDRGRDGVPDIDGAAGRWTGFGFGFGCTAAGGGSGVGSGAGEGGAGSVTTGSVGTGS
jgi:hypothetical protein